MVANEKLIQSITYQANISILTSVWSTCTFLQSASIPSGLTNQTESINNCIKSHINFNRQGHKTNFKHKGKILDLNMHPCTVYLKIFPLLQILCLVCKLILFYIIFYIKNLLDLNSFKFLIKKSASRKGINQCVT